MRIAYLVASATTVEIGELAAAVRDRLREQLPEYMVPDQWVVLEAFPLNAKGGRTSCSARLTARRRP